MTQEEAKKYLNIVALSAVKARSNTIEAIGDDTQTLNVLRDVEPMLFCIEENELNLIKATTLMQQKPFLNRGDLVNLAWMTSKSIATQAAMLLIWETKPLELVDVLHMEFEEVEYGTDAF